MQKSHSRFFNAAALGALFTVGLVPAAMAQDRPFILLPITEKSLHAAYAGVTHVRTLYSLWVDFAAPDGTIYLWVAGAETVAKGEWRANAATSPEGEICTRFAAGSLPETMKGQEDRWSCMTPMLLSFARNEERKGDVFGLSKKSSVPFLLSGGRGDFEKITSRMPPRARADYPQRLPVLVLGPEQAAVFAARSEVRWKPRQWSGQSIVCSEPGRVLPSY